MQAIFSVSELTNEIKKKLESSYPTLSVRGEVSNLKTQASGHCYFTLKDQQAQISCVLFRGATQGLTRLPQSGDQVILHGELNLYPPRGYYQIIVRKVEYAGVGELLLKLHTLKNNLAERGWFDPKRKKALPKFPKRIGIITSPTGAVVQDIIHVLTRRCPNVNILLNPVKVQGEGAAEEIALAIEELNRHQLADVIIVGRGGGSLEDLWAFNEERVAAAIYASAIPVVSAVGHETDYSIADFVADLRAPTPSAAAEIVSAETSTQLQFLKTTRQRLFSHLKAQIAQERGRLLHFQRHPTFSSVYTLLAPYFQKIDDLRESLKDLFFLFLREKRLKLEALQKQNATLDPRTQIAQAHSKLKQFERAFHHALCQGLQLKKRGFNAEQLYAKADQEILSLVKRRKEQLLRLVAHLKGIDPKNLLKNGYCILFNEKKDSVILSSQSVKPHEKVHLLMHDGTLTLYRDPL